MFLNILFWINCSLSVCMHVFISSSWKIVNIQIKRMGVWTTYYIPLDQRWQGWPKPDPKRLLFRLRSSRGMITKHCGNTAQKMKFLCRKLRIWSHLLKKSSRIPVFKPCVKEATVTASFMFNLNLFQARTGTFFRPLFVF